MSCLQLSSNTHLVCAVHLKIKKKDIRFVQEMKRTRQALKLFFFGQLSNCIRIKESAITALQL